MHWVFVETDSDETIWRGVFYMTATINQLKIPIIAMGIIVLSSDILVNFFVPEVENISMISGLTYGAFTFPIVFLEQQAEIFIHTPQF